MILPEAIKAAQEAAQSIGGTILQWEMGRGPVSQLVFIPKTIY